MTTRNFRQVSSVLPLIIDEAQIFAFKFWFNDSIYHGIYHRNELFCRLESFDIEKRQRVYQLGCQLSRQSVIIVLTLAPTTCSLWGGLRSPIVKDILLNPDILKLPGSNLDGRGSTPSS